MSQEKHCVHCGVSSVKATQMIEIAPGTCLCGECIGAIHDFSVGASAKPEAVVEPEKALPAGKTPKEIVQFLDRYIVGQEDAKQTLAIAICNHYKRLSAPADLEVELDKSNILLLGPSGTGKTLLASTIARVLDVPFTIADATSLTQAGYVGDDVETILQRLIQAADGDIEKAERGIVFVDEIDKISRASAGPSVTRDVSGEGVQQALLKLIEGAKVSVPVSGNRKNPGSQMNYIDTKNILFICAGAFVPVLEKIHKPKKAKASVGFLAPAPAPAAEESKDVTPEMLFEFGMIPEFIGRLPVIATLAPLDVDALERILTEPKNALVRQMSALFAMDDATLVFEEGSLRAVAEQAFKLKTGARGARSILEKLLKSALFEVPGTQGATVTVMADLSVRVDYALALAA